MLSVLFALFALAEVLLLGLVVTLRRRQPDWALTLLILVIIALIWDNAVIALGSTIGEGGMLRALSVPRYVTHALLVPLLIMVAVGLGRRYGVRFFAGRIVPGVFGVLTLALVAVGVQKDVIALDLEATRYADTLRYTNAASEGPPIPAIVAILVMIGVGVALLVRARWPWLLAGAVVMFAAAAAAPSILWLSNFGELALILTVWLTAARRDLADVLTAAAPRSAVGR
ncbi:hypothetical protein ACTI_40250 [Actinoplanes sp. OR16]|uniref:hypothetical protein n=1 Tax=Actinoplanes sp. OR16 TaxID=946334 RepID=UPI000F6FD9BA|nr:hypothetical protein [Actinoplanes sp. OR16]BBH67340.1 hypothetical protein ACTI_40250 [Actinoplanes sp. OR16]